MESCGLLQFADRAIRTYSIAFEQGYRNTRVEEYALLLLHLWIFLFSVSSFANFAVQDFALVPRREIKFLNCKGRKGFRKEREDSEVRVDRSPLRPSQRD